MPRRIGPVRRAFAVEVGQHDDTARAGRRGQRERVEPARDRRRAGGPPRRSPWWRSGCTPAAGTGRWHRRSRRPRRSGRRVGVSLTANTVPDVPSEITTSPGCRPRPRAAAMLSPVPEPTTSPASTVGLGRPSTSAAPDQSSVAVDDLQQVEPVLARRRRPVPGTRRVAAVGDVLAGQPPGEPVVREHDRSTRSNSSGSVRCNHDELRDRERGHRHRAARGRPRRPRRRRAGRAASRRRAPTRCRSTTSRTQRRRRPRRVTTRPCCCAGDRRRPRHRRDRRPRPAPRRAPSHQPRVLLATAAGSSPGAAPGPTATSAPVSASRTSTLVDCVDESTPTTTASASERRAAAR